MKTILLIVILVIVLNEANAQGSVGLIERLRFRPLPLEQPEDIVIPRTSLEIEIERAKAAAIYNSYNNNTSKTKSIDFDNTTLNFYKVRHVIEKNDAAISDDESTENRKFIIRTNYIIDEKNNFVWDIKKKEYDSENDGMKFYCIRDKQYVVYFFIKMDGAGIVEYWEDENKRLESYYFY